MCKEMSSDNIRNIERFIQDIEQAQKELVDSPELVEDLERRKQFWIQRLKEWSNGRVEQAIQQISDHIFKENNK